MNPTDSNGNPNEGSSQARTPGALLRAAREARGLHLGVLAVTLKVPVRQLEALENDDYTVFRGPAFVRAVAQSVCRQLGLDPGPVLAGLPQAVSPLGVKPHTSSTQPSPGLGTSLPTSRRRLALPFSRQVLALAGLMLAGSVALIWWPARTASAPEQTSPWAPAPASSEAGTEEALPVSVNVPSVPDASAPSASPLPANPASLPAAEALVPVAPLKAALAATASSPAASAEANTASAPRAAEGLLIQASGDTWLEVRNGAGQLVSNRLLRQGESETVTLQPPFNVVLGRAHAARVSWRGQNFDLAPHTKVSTARFDILP